MILSGAAHHLDVERRGVPRRQRDQRRRIAVPVAEVAVDARRGCCAPPSRDSCAPPTGCCRLWRQLIDVVDLVDRHALVGEVQHLVVEVGVGVALRAHDFLDARVAPARPAVRGEHHFGLAAEPVQRRVDLLRPLQRIAHQRAAQRVDVVDRAGDVLGRPERLELRELGVHLRRRFGAGRVLEHHLHAVDGQFLEVLARS